MARAAHELALQAWIVTATGLADGNVIFANSRPSAGRPGKPYATLMVTGERTPDDPFQETLDEVLGSGVKHSIHSFREGAVSVQFFGPDHAELSAALDASLNDPSVRLDFDASGVLVTNSGGSPGTFNMEALDTRFESRSARTYIYRHTRQIDVEVAPVESLVSEPTFT